MGQQVDVASASIFHKYNTVSASNDKTFLSSFPSLKLILPFFRIYYDFKNLNQV